jgi:hypothetical protein
MLTISPIRLKIFCVVIGSKVKEKVIFGTVAFLKVL